MFSVVCEKCPEFTRPATPYMAEWTGPHVHDVKYKRHGRSVDVYLSDANGDVHHLGLILGSAKNYSGYWACPSSRQRKIDADPADYSEAAYTGPPTVKGFKNRRLAAEYLLRAEGFWSWDS